jgi:PAS domain S-box-containing protein
MKISNIQYNKATHDVYLKKSREELIKDLQEIHLKHNSLKSLYEKDITEHKQAVETLTASETRYRRLFESAKDGILILDAETGKITDVNPFLIEKLGYSREQFIEKEIWEIGFFKDIVANKDKFLELQQNGYVRYEDLPLKTTDGKQINVEFVSNVYSENHHKVIQCNIRDITERKRAEMKLQESEEKYRLISTVSSDYMFSSIITLDGISDLKWVAGAFENITGYSIDEYKTKGGWRASIHPDDIAKDEIDLATLQANRKVITEIRTIKKSGEIIWVKIYAHPVWDEDKNCLVEIYGAVQDISERKKAEEQIVKINSELDKLVKERTIELENTNVNLQKEIAERLKDDEFIKQQLQEKEVLLKEIHHRVKNNMQVIISILNLQASFIKDEKVLNILQDSQSRIKTMALIHEKLYQTKDFSNINFSEYITNLLNYLFSSYKSPKQQIKYQINIDLFPFEIDIIIPLGLITNELVSNSIKYSCIDEINCEIEVSLKKYDEKNIVLSIKDNGKGLPIKFDYKNTESLGMQLVCVLAEQIRGKVDIQSSDKGTTFSIIFPSDKPI